MTGNQGGKASHYEVVSGYIPAHLKNPNLARTMDNIIGQRKASSVSVKLLERSV